MEQVTQLQIIGADNYTAICDKFLKTYGLKKVIGFSGSADSKLNGIPDKDPLQEKYKKFHDALHERIISDVLKVLRGHKVAILTGGTEGGIPELATQKAKIFGFKTIGVFPKVGKKYSLGNSLIDLSIMVDPLIGESQWGDEGSVWTALIDAMIVISGQAGTLTECAHIQKINEALIKNDKTPKYIIPIYGTGGIAEQLPYLWSKPEIKSKSMPLERIYTGKQAADFIIGTLELEYELDVQKTTSKEIYMSKIEIPPISGFPEFLPQYQIKFNEVVSVIRQIYELAGAVPIETPAVERVETLLSKGGVDKEIYGLRRLSSDGGDDAKDLALHFDLTVPLARYVAQHRSKLVFPFRRYQIQPVWRGERAQAGRYRQFYQCDIDVIGDGELSLLNDAEMPFIIYQIFKELKIGDFFIRLNNRKILQGFFAAKGLGLDKIRSALKIVDSLEKSGTAQVTDQLKSLDLDKRHINDILEFFSKTGSNTDIIKYLESLTINQEFETGVEELSQVTKGIDMLGVPSEYCGIDLSIARGLDYYTGTIYETRLSGNSSIGSICSGGRYDDLTTYFTDKQYPGVGVSIGLTRLVSKLFQLKIFEPTKQTVAPVLVTSIEQDKNAYLKIGRILRDVGINTEVYLEDKKLGEQMRYAQKKGFKYVILCGQEEFEKNVVILRNMENGDQETIERSSLVEALKHRLMSI